ncbi:hypothetical protein [Nocardia sp. NPDC057272]|uniref:hypothetical protein n=1 Tax=Nocardia sp. NPDC057272 TaxID=3346079 RepID=UPI00363F9E39
MLTARTLAEATTYLSLVAASDVARHGPPETSLTEGTQAWTVHSQLGDVAAHSRRTWPTPPGPVRTARLLS